MYMYIDYMCLSHVINLLEPDQRLELSGVQVTLANSF